MTNTQSPIFIDSDALIALAKIDDANHQKAIRLFCALQKQKLPAITSNLVFAEVVTVLSQRVGRSAALAFIDTMQASDNDLPVLYIDQELHKQAITVFKRQTSKNVSYVDCANMAIVQMLSCDAVLSFDDVYRKNKISVFA